MTIAASSERDRRDNAKQRVLEALVGFGATGLTNTALNAICYRYGARIHELRAEGYGITKVHEGAGVYRYTLTGRDDGQDAAATRFVTALPPVVVPVAPGRLF